MDENNKGGSQKLLDNTSKIGKTAFKVALVANVVGVLACIFSLLRIFSLYAIIVLALSIAISFIGYTVLLCDIMKFKQLHKSEH